MHAKVFDAILWTTLAANAWILLVGMATLLTLQLLDRLVGRLLTTWARARAGSPDRRPRASTASRFAFGGASAQPAGRGAK